MSFAPFKHQESNSEKLVSAISNVGAALDASDLGTGKTVTALLTAKRLGAKPAIICPLAVIPSWRDACKLVGVEPLFIENYEAGRTARFTWGNYRGSSYWWDQVPLETLMIFDEVHRCRGKETLPGKMLRASAYRCRTLMASATPFTSPTEAHNIGLALRLFNGNSFTRWCFDHGVRRGRFAGQMVFKGGEEDMLKIHAQIFNGGRGVRTRVDEIPGFPETQILTTGVACASPADLAQIYMEELNRKLEEATHRATNPIMMGFDPGVFVPLLRYRQLAELQKCGAMAEMARDLRDQGFSVALFVNFSQSVEVLQKLLETDMVVTGEIHGGIRQNNCTRFQWNKEPFIILNSQAGGTGISLHDLTGAKKPRASLISPSYNAFDFRQIFGRVRRAGGGRSIQHIVYLRDTVEEEVVAKVGRKLDNLDTLVDGDLCFSSEINTL